MSFWLDSTELVSIDRLMIFARDPLAQRTVFPFLGMARLPSVYR